MFVTTSNDVSHCIVLPGEKQLQIGALLCDSIPRTRVITASALSPQHPVLADTHIGAPPEHQKSIYQQKSPYLPCTRFLALDQWYVTLAM